MHIPLCQCYIAVFIHSCTTRLWDMSQCYHWRPSCMVGNYQILLKLWSIFIWDTLNMVMGLYVSYIIIFTGSVLIHMNLKFIISIIIHRSNIFNRIYFIVSLTCYLIMIIWCLTSSKILSSPVIFLLTLVKFLSKWLKSPTHQDNLNIYSMVFQ